MKKTHSTRLRLTIAATLFATSTCLPLLATAQSYPTKTVKIIVPFPAGGVTDLIARLISDKLSPIWGQTVIVDNRAGASGMIGADAVAKSEPDGHTLLLSSTAEVAINQNLYKSMAYDPAKDLLPITLTATTPLIWVAHPSTGIKDIESAKTVSKQAPVTYASAGSGGVQHMAGALLETKTRLGLSHIPYRGGSPAVADVLAGHVQTSISSAPLVVPHINDKKLTALAVTSSKRMASLPDVPTVNEALSIDDFEILNWYGLYAPKGTSEEILDKINKDVVAVLKIPDIEKRITDAGADPIGSSRVDFKEFWHREMDKYAQIIKESGAKVD
ncbi:tripartite tricarboxylate transporter substrate binding protein [Pusillimonas sp. MFBS29]|uniref:Bug family tripartite tricarboxylate transporter substrate binding protein n=1 Tax=Pusillimonas sp. MFBS29 TaxID=2886690 RepID=UPI001D11A9D6|nr:tripartite tricarboxylate transporter substrate binding protein [Pusillimonas sp. MFBS29]MCC2597515.1 tripartite tricarboxylate transporter substrate binding protein [Pusillimonas sp. MFBS29]